MAAIGGDPPSALGDELSAFNDKCTKIRKGEETTEDACSLWNEGMTQFSKPEMCGLPNYSKAFFNFLAALLKLLKPKDGVPPSLKEPIKGLSSPFLDLWMNQFYYCLRGLMGISFSGEDLLTMKNNKVSFAAVLKCTPKGSYEFRKSFFETMKEKDANVFPAQEPSDKDLDDYEKTELYALCSVQKTEFYNSEEQNDDETALKLIREIACGACGSKASNDADQDHAIEEKCKGFKDCVLCIDDVEAVACFSPSTARTAHVEEEQEELSAFGCYQKLKSPQSKTLFLKWLKDQQKK